MDMGSIECLTLENADFKTGQVHKTGLTIWAGVLAMPVIAITFQIWLNPEPLNRDATLITTSTFSEVVWAGILLFLALGYLVPPIIMWQKYRQLDPTFRLMLADPAGKKLLEQGDRLADQLKWLTEAENKSGDGLHQINTVSGTLGRGTPEFVTPMYDEIVKECDDLRAVIHTEAKELRKKQNDLLQKIRTDHNLPPEPELKNLEVT
jgi:hypothetical protein